MQIGTGFHKATEEGKEFISVSIDEVVKLQYPMLNEINITLWQNSDKRSEKSPDWSVQIQKKKPREYEEVPM